MNRGRAGPPSPSDRALELQFLKEHWQYGGTIHEATAEALVTALSTESGPATGHSLFLRLFTEYAMAMENLGAWGWTFLNYHQYPLFLDAFLDYRHKAPASFYRAVERNPSGPLTRLLQLPERKTLDADVAEVLGFSLSEYEAMCGECMGNLPVAARQYFGDEQIVRLTYNKAKHGATMVRPAAILDPREFCVITTGRGADRYDMTKFRVDRQMISTVDRGVRSAGLSIRLLAGMAYGLLTRGHLYR